MDVKLLNPFIQAAIEVLKAEVGATVSRKDLSLQKSSLTSDDITVLINLVGDVYGVVMYGMPMSTGLNMVFQFLATVVGFVFLIKCISPNTARHPADKTVLRNQNQCE